LLNTVQVLLDESPKRFQFLLTGSSARKLRRGDANLLPGRIHTYHLGPITAGELDYRMDTRAAVAVGTLPGILSEESRADQEKTLRSYGATYLKEEVQAESLSRNLEGFARFITVAAEWAGRHLDISKMAAAAQVTRQSVARYFDVLEDTLLVHRVPPLTLSANRRLVQHPKFYFFDVGVRNGLLGSFRVDSDRIGLLFEQLVFSQLLASAYAADQEITISTYRTEHGAEVDFIIELGDSVWALELKASRHVVKSDLRGLRSFAEVCRRKHTPLVLYLGDVARKIEGCDVLPWREGLRRIGL
jgi:predicted AAA+ superfamily ATPase